MVKSAGAGAKAEGVGATVGAKVGTGTGAAVGGGDIGAGVGGAIAGERSPTGEAGPGAPRWGGGTWSATAGEAGAGAPRRGLRLAPRLWRSRPGARG
jgi:hypothetical protein